MNKVMKWRIGLTIFWAIFVIPVFKLFGGIPIFLSGTLAWANPIAVVVLFSLAAWLIYGVIIPRKG